MKILRVANQKVLTTTRDPYDGDVISYVPASRIKQINIRHIPKISYSSTAAGAAADFEGGAGAFGCTVVPGFGL